MNISSSNIKMILLTNNTTITILLCRFAYCVLTRFNATINTDFDQDLWGIEVIL